MKDHTRAELEASRPSVGATNAIDFCLDSLYSDKKRKISDYVAGNCTYEELIGALLLAKDWLAKE